MIRRHDRPKPQPKPKAKRIVRRAAPTVPGRAPEQKAEQRVGQRQPRPLVNVRAMARRGRARVRARWLPIAAAAVLLAVAVGGVWAWQSPLLRVQEVEVVGAVSARESDIIEQVALWGERMFTADLNGTAKAIEELPLIASVDIERSWPSTVRITVHEREPWGSWEQAGLRYTIDREGFVLGHRAPPADSTTIVSNESFSLRPGDRVDYHAVDAAAEITSHIQEALGTTRGRADVFAGRGHPRSHGGRPDGAARGLERHRLQARRLGARGAGSHRARHHLLNHRPAVRGQARAAVKDVNEGNHEAK